MKAYISRLIIGGVIILIGLALLLDTLNIANTGSIINDWWPMLIVIGGVLMLVNHLKDYLWAVIVIVVGVLIQVRTLGYTDVNIWNLIWPFFLIGIGASIVFNRPGANKGSSRHDSDDVSAILGGSDHINTSTDYKGGSATAVLGGVKLDLRKAVIKKSATVNLLVVLGGAEIIVPRGIVVKNRTNSILGGVESKTDQDIITGAPELIITGDVIAGGVEIKN